MHTPASYFYVDEIDGALRAAEHIVPLVLATLGPIGSVVDLGGGTGAWLRAFQRHGVSQIRLFDTPAVKPGLLVDGAAFTPVDLERRMPEPTRADLAVCVEVAEHLSATRAHPLVEWLTATSDQIVFSAAVPGQGGKGHVNEQFSSYWSALFASRGFERHDVLRGPLAHIEEVPTWYRQNVLVYARQGAGPTAADLLPESFRLMHEHNTIFAPLPPAGLGAWAREFRPTLARTLRNRLGRR